MITTLQFHIKMSQERMVNKFSYCTILEKLQNKAKYLITFWEDCIQNWLKLKQAHCVNIAKIYHNFLWRWKMLALILWQHGGLIKMQDMYFSLWEFFGCEKWDKFGLNGTLCCLLYCCNYYDSMYFLLRKHFKSLCHMFFCFYI